MLCQDCCKREQCKKLCPEAEAYANQDHVRKKEMLKRNIYSGDYRSAFGQRDLSAHDLKKLILACHRDGMSGREIAYHLPCHYTYICRVIKKGVH